MGGWGTEGIRRHLGFSYTEEHRETITWPAGVLTFTPETRTITTERAEFIGLTKAAAATFSPTSGFDVKARDPVGESGQWKVTEEKVTTGEWTAD